MSLPVDIKPIIASVRRLPFDRADWLFEPKYDGYRALLYVEPGQAFLVSRNGHVFGRFDKLAASIAATLKANAAVLDGEVMACDPSGRPVFMDLLRAKAAPCFVAFDLLWVDGEDLRELPLVERKRQLRLARSAYRHGAPNSANWLKRFHRRLDLIRHPAGIPQQIRHPHRAPSRRGSARALNALSPRQCSDRPRNASRRTCSCPGLETRRKRSS